MEEHHNRPRRVGIITGASSGLGREFAIQAAEQRLVDELWLIARREVPLRQLAGKLPIPTRVLPMDLTDRASADQLEALLAQSRPQVYLLVNAAGFGRIGTYAEISRQDCSRMIDLNCRAAVELTNVVIPYLVRGSRVLEICSTAAFQPLPGMSVYAATKAMLLRYTHALHWELRSKGIHVTAVCPYWVRDTEFIPVAQETSKTAAVRHFPLAGQSRRVVRLALDASARNAVVSTPGAVSLMHRLTSKILPHSLMIAGWEGIRRL